MELIQKQVQALNQQLLQSLELLQMIPARSGPGESYGRAQRGLFRNGTKPG